MERRNANAVTFKAASDKCLSQADCGCLLWASGEREDAFVLFGSKTGIKHLFLNHYPTNLDFIFLNAGCPKLIQSMVEQIPGRSHIHSQFCREDEVQKRLIVLITKNINLLP